jgi:hypothetical protein
MWIECATVRSDCAARDQAALILDDQRTAVGRGCGCSGAQSDEKHRNTERGKNANAAFLHESLSGQITESNLPSPH